MKYKHIIVVFVLGMIFTTIGALLKIMHWPMASGILTSGMLAEVLACLMLIYKLIVNKNSNDILNK